MKKVLWFSRHLMSAEQRAALGDVDIIQISRSISSAMELKKDIDKVDIVAIVAPIGLQAEFLKVANDKPVIVALSERVLVPANNPDDHNEDVAVFKFIKWERLVKVEVVKEDFKI